MKKQTAVWVIEDDQSSRFVYEEIFSLRYELTLFSCLTDFRHALLNSPTRPDLLIADLRLPDESFLSFLSAGEHHEKLTFPFIVVSSIDDLDALRLCYEKGAADYITKPFGRGELIVKVERILSPHPASNATAGGLFLLDPKSLTVSRAERTSDSLTSKEFQLLAILHDAQNNTLTRDEMIEQLWGKVKVTSKTLDVHLSNLRRKVEPLGLEIIHVFPNSYRILGALSNRMNE